MTHTGFTRKPDRAQHPKTESTARSGEAPQQNAQQGSPLWQAGPVLRLDTPVQMIKVTTQFDPKNPTHSKEKEIETDTLSPQELLEMLTHGRNKQRDMSALLPVIESRIDQETWTLLLRQNAKLVSQAYGYLKETGAAGAIQQASRGLLEDGFLPDENPMAVFELKKLSGMSKEELSEYQDLFDRAIMWEGMARREREMAEAQGRMQVIRRYFQTALDFWTTVPDGVVDERKSAFMDLLHQLDEAIGITGGDTPYLTLEEEDQTMVESFVNHLAAEAKAIVSAVEDEDEFFPKELEQTLPKEDQQQVALLRGLVQKALGPCAAGVAKLIPGAVIRYRGSLTDAIKNFTKSVSFTKFTELDLGKKAIPINLGAFDVDAYVEIPDSQWKDWEKKGLLPDRKDSPIKGKVVLEVWKSHLQKVNTSEATSLSETVDQLQELEEECRNQLAKVPGYKLNQQTSRPDFDLVAQPEAKTKKEKEYGKPYPLGEVSKGGSPYQELVARMEMLREDGVQCLAVWLPEKHIEIEPEEVD